AARGDGGLLALCLGRYVATIEREGTDRRSPPRRPFSAHEGRNGTRRPYLGRRSAQRRNPIVQRLRRAALRHEHLAPRVQHTGLVVLASSQSTGEARDAYRRLTKPINSLSPSPAMPVVLGAPHRGAPQLVDGLRAER